MVYLDAHKAVLISGSHSMGHSACPEEIDDVEAFLTERLPNID
jgi:predicted esterase